MAHSHAVVWIDHREARVFSFGAEDAEKKRIRADEPRHKVRHAGNVEGGNAVRDNRQFFEAILASLEQQLKDVGEWLIVGPGDTKKDFQKYVEGHAEMLASKLVGIGPMEDPTDDELVTAARQHFKALESVVGRQANG